MEYQFSSFEVSQTNVGGGDSQFQILPVSQIQLSVVHNTIDCTALWVDRFDDSIIGDLTSLLKFITTLVLSA